MKTALTVASILCLASQPAGATRLPTAQPISDIAKMDVPCSPIGPRDLGVILEMPRQGLQNDK